MVIRSRETTRNIDFDVITSHDGSWSYDAIHAVLLMDIRDELKRLNRTLACPNFLGIPHTLTRIRENTAKPKRRRKPADPVARLAKRWGVP